MKWIKRPAAQIPYHYCVRWLETIQMTRSQIQTQRSVVEWMDRPQRFNHQMYVYQSNYHWKISSIRHRLASGMQAWRISTWIVLAQSVIEWKCDGIKCKWYEIPAVIIRIEFWTHTHTHTQKIVQMEIVMQHTYDIDRPVKIFRFWLVCSSFIHPHHWSRILHTHSYAK